MNENFVKETEENLRTPSTEANDEVRLLAPKDKINDDEMKYQKNDKPRAIDLILNSIGYTKYHFILIFCCGLTYFSEGDALLSLNMLMPSLNKIFSKNSETWKTLLASSLYFGYVSGTFLTGYLTKTVGRRFSLNICLFLFSLLSISLGLVENIHFMTFCRFMIGVTMGVVLPQNIANLSEFLPSENKELVILSMYIFYRLGIIYFIMCFSITQPDIHLSNWKEAFLLAAIPIIVVTILTNVFFMDSPKLHLSKNELIQAVDTISHLKGETGSDQTETLRLLMEDMNSANRTQIEASYFNIFHKDYFRLSILCSLIFLTTSMVNVIYIYALPIILVKRQQDSFHSNSESPSIVAQEMLITQIVTIPAILLAALVCKFIGRKNTIAIGMILCFIASSIPAYFGKKIIFSSTLVNFFIIFGQCTIKVYLIEAFPTKLRDYSLAFCYFVSKFGDALTPIFCNLAFRAYIYGPIIIANILCLIGSICTLLLPFDTLGLHVD
jgi:MFS family permease